MFLVKWKGWSQETNTWEPLVNLTNCSELLEQFWVETLEQKVLKDLQDWLGVQLSMNREEVENIAKDQDLKSLPNKFDLTKELLQIVAVSREKRTEKMFENSIKTLYIYLLVVEREKQQTKLKIWEDEINSISGEKVPLKVENNVDLENPPDGFIYVNAYVPSDGIAIPDDPPIGCSCVECLPKCKTCCFGQLPVFPYRKRGRVNVMQGTPIYECNKRCKCDETCRNRVVQFGRKVPLCIFRTSTGCGWGVKTLRKIHDGEFICEYVGELISFEEAERRGQGYDARGQTYLFDLDFNSHNDYPYTVDAATYGNVSHFINHSCEPNLAVWAVWVNCLDPNIPKLALFALREIEKDEELTFDYKSANTTNSSPRLTVQSENNTEMQNCKCGTKSCRKYLF